jgi:hypothetical protein
VLKKFKTLKKEKRDATSKISWMFSIEFLENYFWLR